MQPNKVWNSWHMLTLIGGIVALHGIATGVLVPGSIDPRMMTSMILFSCGVCTLIISLMLRKWTGARIYFWIGGLRLVGALAAITTRVPGGADYRHLVVVMMILISVLEFLAAARLRQADEPHRALQLSAVIGILASAGLLHNYPVISDEKMGVLLGVSMSMSGLAIIGLGFVTRHLFQVAQSALQQVESTEPAKASSV